MSMETAGEDQYWTAVYQFLTAVQSSETSTQTSSSSAYTRQCGQRLTEAWHTKSAETQAGPLCTHLPGDASYRGTPELLRAAFW